MLGLRLTALGTILSLSLIAPGAIASQDGSPRGYFISIDGLNPALLDALDGAGVLNKPKGLGELHRKSLVVDRATPVVTLTAASHISTVTCSPPSRHGIVANGYLKDGKKVSGYSHPFTTEPMWRAAMRQGKKVLALAYVGSDGPTPERTADWALNYPDDTLIGPNQTLELTTADLPQAAGWQVSPTLDLAGAHESTVTLTLNPKTTETALVNVLIVANTVAGQPDLYFDSDKDLTNGHFGTLRGGDALTRTVDMFAIEQHADSTLKGAKRRAFARRLPADAGKISVYVSKPSYNAAYPASFRQTLDDLNLVWPDYGVKSPKLSVAEVVEAQSMIDRFLTEVAIKATSSLDPDIVLFYQPLIDTVGHKLQGALPIPFDPNGQDDATRAFVEAFRIVDQNVSRLLAATRQQDVVALMGDHGMDPIKKVVNVARLLPADHVGKIEVVTSGALTMLYVSPLSTDPDRNLIAKTIGQGLKDALQTLRDGEIPVANMASNRDDFLATPDPGGDFTKEWAFGEAIWAFSSASGYWYQYNPLNTNLFIDPPALGMHGHVPTLPSMATKLLIKGPRIRARHISDGSLIDAVPTFMKLLGLEPPRDCLGRSLL